MNRAAVRVLALSAAGLLLFAAGKDDAQKLLDQGKYAEAANAFSELTKTSPDDAALLAGYGKALNGLGRFRDAVAPLGKAIEKDPRNHSILRELIRAFIGAGDFVEAERFLNLLLRVNPNDEEGWYLFGVLLYQNGYYGTAQKAFEKVLKAGAPGKADVYHAICLLRLNRSEAAEAAFRRLLAQPTLAGDLDLLIGYAQLSYEKGDHDGATKLSSRAAELAPRNPEARLWLARCLTMKGDWAAAARQAERASALAPAQPQAHSLLLRIYQKLGRSKEAQDQLTWLREHERRKTLGRTR